MISIFLEVLKIASYCTNVGQCSVKWFRNQVHRLLLLLYVAMATLMGVFGPLICPSALGHDGPFIATRCMQGYLLPKEKLTDEEEQWYKCSSPPKHDEFV